MNDVLANFIDGYAVRGINLDDFQINACRAIGEGRDVLVCAPTGSGKTVVAHYAVELALGELKRCVYTAPIKALTNQKFTELVARHGEDHVGLLTGDETINRDADILVVTTEVLRNMLFAQSEDIADIGYVVLDEVHYLADPERGPVWEEVILTLPAHVRLVSLSATVANTGELLGWLTSVRGETTLVTSTHRPVPLEQHVLAGRKIFPVFGKTPGQPHRAMIDALTRLDDPGRGRVSDADRRRIIKQLEEADMLPAIEFIFSRKGCDQAVTALVRRDITLTTREEQKAIRARIKEVRDGLTESDRRAIRFESTANALIHGYGAHHAGVFPAIKSLTERLMEEGLLRIVYATGTLALGIDMPVRSVVVEELRRWNGSGFVDLSVTEYTQLIGRAGRRGRDTVGHAVVVGTPHTNPYALADLGSGRIEPLLSAFAPSYNTVVNLVADRPYLEARAIMGRSFAQYQRNADLVGIEARMDRIRKRIVREEQQLTHNCGDVVEFVRNRASTGRAAKSARKAAKREYRLRIEASFSTARNGRVYAYQREGELVYALLLSAGSKHRVIDWYGDIRWLHLHDLGSEMREVTTVAIPSGRSLKDRQTRDDIADSILEAVDERNELGIDRDLLGSWSRFAQPTDAAHHECENCPESAAHIRRGEALVSLDARLAELNELVSGYTDSVGREFDATARILAHLGILQGTAGEYRISHGSHGLRSLHCENDLLLYQAMAALPDNSLTASEFAGWASAFLSEDRLGSRPPRSRNLARLIHAASGELAYLRSLEEAEGIERVKDLTPGCCDVFAAWAEGAGLEECLDTSRMAAGDFINTARRLIDLLGNIATSTEGTWIAEIASDARSLIRRSEVTL